jgi:beta-glucosidase
MWLLVATLITAARFVSFADEPRHDAVAPVDRPHDWWQERNAQINARLAEGDVDLVFLGDSITQGWNDNAVWKEHYGPRRAANMGIGGDRTQHILWRLDHAPLDKVSPKLVVLMIGTNNSNGDDNTAAEIADGIKAIMGRLRTKWPMTKVLVLAIFPRGETPNPQREKNAEASRLAGEVADGQMVHYLDIGERFTSADGTIDKAIMPDYLHLSIDGYKIWAAAIEEKVKELMGEEPQG